MKKTLLLLTFTTLLFSCKQNSEKKKLDPNTPVIEITKNLTQYQGEYIYTKEAAVLKGKDFIYGVVLNDVAKNLAQQVEKIKKDEFDMVPVVIKGIVNKKAVNEKGWDEIITIKEIVEVSETPIPADIKIDSDKN